MGTPPTPQGILQKKNTTHVAKFAPSLRPVPLPPTPPQPKPLHPPRPPSQPFPDPFSGLALCTPTKPPFFGTAIAPTPPQPSPATKALGLPPRPPGQLRWVPPPHRTGHPFHAIFLFFVRVRLLRSWGPCLYYLPPRNRSPCTPRLPDPPSTKPALVGPPSLSPPSQPFPDPFPGIKALGLPPRPPGQLRWVPPPIPQGILQKKPFFFFLYALETTKIRHAKFAPSLGPVPLPPTPPQPKPLHFPRPPSQPFPDPFPGLAPLCNSHPLLWNCHHPYTPPNPLLQPRPLVYPPVHQASSGVYPPPNPTGHPSKKAIFLLFVRVRNNKNTTHVAKFAPSLGPVSLPLTPPGTEALAPPLSPCPASLTPVAKPSQPFPDPFLYPPVHQASSGGILQKKPFFFFLYALETTKIRHTLRNLLRP